MNSQLFTDFEKQLVMLDAEAQSLIVNAHASALSPVEVLEYYKAFDLDGLISIRDTYKTLGEKLKVTDQAGEFSSEQQTRVIDLSLNIKKNITAVSTQFNAIKNQLSK